MCEMDSNGSGLVLASETFEYGKEFSCFIRRGEFRDQLRDHQLLQQDSILTAFLHNLKHLTITHTGAGKALDLVNPHRTCSMHVLELILSTVEAHINCTSSTVQEIKSGSVEGGQKADELAGKGASCLTLCSGSVSCTLAHAYVSGKRLL